MRVKQWIYADDCIVQVEVDAVIPDADPSEPCLEPPALRYLDHLQELANAGNIAELERHGNLFVRKSA